MKLIDLLKQLERANLEDEIEFSIPYGCSGHPDDCRCYCPDSKPGTLEVACFGEGKIILHIS